MQACHQLPLPEPDVVESVDYEKLVFFEFPGYLMGCLGVALLQTVDGSLLVFTVSAIEHNGLCAHRSRHSRREVSSCAKFIVVPAIEVYQSAFQLISQDLFGILGSEPNEHPATQAFFTTRLLSACLALGWLGLPRFCLSVCGIVLPEERPCAKDSE